MAPIVDRSTEFRERMVKEQIASRGVRDPLVLQAMRRVPREKFLRESFEEFAYQDTPLPIESDQTISQPFIVAYMTECLGLRGGEKVLEIGTGSGYAAAVLAEIAGQVYTVERYANLARNATARLERLGYANVHVLHGDGTEGWPAHAPYDAIVVAAGGPEVPTALREQLAIGGRLVIPVGSTARSQQLVRVTRVDEHRFEQEELMAVAFVPLIGRQGWQEGAEAPSRARPASPARPAGAPALSSVLAAACEPFEDIDRANLDRLYRRIGDARVVLLGEATHGTSEFYRLRARITRDLVEHHGFTVVAAEADWPDAARIDHFVRDLEHPAPDWIAFTRFPTWMWRNHEMRELVDWLRERNRPLPPERRAGFYGLDLYSLHTSIAAVLAYLDTVDPEAAAIARTRYGCLTPWQSDPATYGSATLSGQYRSCEADVVRMLQDLLDHRLRYVGADGERYFDAVQNARLVAQAERYYRVMYYGGPESWNLRDGHMFQTLQRVLRARGADGRPARAVVWAHNSHVGDASATEMGARGEFNIGQLCRDHFGSEIYSIGFGTDRGTVAAATHWGGAMEIKRVRPSDPRSYERLCHETGIPRFLVGLRAEGELRAGLTEPRLERAIGVIYRPETEIASHYFAAHLPRQFDEYVWFDESQAVRPLESHEVAGLPATYPFGV